MGLQLSRRAERPSIPGLRHGARFQRHHRGHRRRPLRRQRQHAPSADGGLPAQGEVRPLLRPAQLHGDFHGRPLSVHLRQLDRGPRRTGRDRRLRARRLLPAEPGAPRPDGRLPPEGEVRLGLHAAPLHGRLPRRGLPFAVRRLDRATRRGGHHRRLREAATTVRSTPTPGDRWRFSSSRRLSSSRPGPKRGRISA